MIRSEKKIKITMKKTWFAESAGAGKYTIVDKKGNGWGSHM